MKAKSNRVTRGDAYVLDPVVSVIIAAYNAQDYIQRAICSVLGQSFSDLEVIVVDDCSSDNTVKLARQFTDRRVRVYVNPRNLGPSFCRNLAIREAAGKWIAVLDSDDWWHRERLKVLIQQATCHSSDIICDDMYLIRDGEDSIYGTYLKSRQKIIGVFIEDTIISTERMIHDDYGFLQPLIKSSLISENHINYWNGVRHGEDFVFLLQCMLAGGKMLIHPQPMYYYRSREGSLTTNAIDSMETQVNNIVRLVSNLPQSHHRYITNLQDYIRRKKSHLRLLKFEQYLKNKELAKAVRLIDKDLLMRLLKNRVLSFMAHTRLIH